MVKQLCKKRNKIPAYILFYSKRSGVVIFIQVMILMFFLYLEHDIQLTKICSSFQNNSAVIILTDFILLLSFLYKDKHISKDLRV